MTYQEMLDNLSTLDEQQRRVTIQHHWQAVLSDGFVAFVQGQLEGYRKMALGQDGMERVYAAMTHDLEKILRQQALLQIAKTTDVWDSMVAIYETLQKHSERQGSSGGMVDHGRHTAMPRGVSVAAAGRCYRCGATAAGQGLCNGCLATQQDWEQDDLDYERQRYDQQRDLQDYQRLQDDQLYHDQQMDFNPYNDYGSDY